MDAVQTMQKLTPTHQRTMTTLEEIDKERVAQHVAIIMDGNGRWAMKQQHERLFGHRNAFTAVRQAVEAAVHTGVRYLTLYTFSAENWNRPQAEGDGLMPETIGGADSVVVIPMMRGVDSLNVAAASAVVFYELGKK